MKVTIINRNEMKDILGMKEVIEGVENVYRLKAQGQTAVWPHVCYDFEEKKAVMDIKSGYVRGDINLHGAKMLNTFPDNTGTDIPVFNGLLMVFDSNTGAPLGMMDASYVTCMRTGAAGAIGIKTLAREDSETLFVLGAGKQAVFQIAATLLLMPKIKKVYVADVLSLENAQSFSIKMPQILNQDFNIHDRQYVEFQAVENMAECIGKSDIIITITPSRQPVIKKEWVKPGTHFSCVGADMSGKEEIFPENFQGARIFADDKPQCIHVGEMELAIKGGYITEDDVLGEIGQVLEGQIQGRTNNKEVTIFDATGIALLDLVTAKIAITSAKQKQIGTFLEI